MKQIDLISPRRGEAYTLKDVLEKGIFRAAITWKNFELDLVHTCFYGSNDYILRVEDLECTQSHWTNSVNFRINGIIPIHTTADGKMSVGFGCGCDSRHGGQFPSEAGPDHPDWDDYQHEDMGELTAWLAPGDSVENIDDIPVEEVLEDEESSKILEQIIKDMICRDIFCWMQEEGGC